MLAPANFGSPMAHMGKSMLARILKGLDKKHLFQTGTRILQSLDMASPFSWELAHDDLFNKENQIFRTKNLFTTVLVGSSSYPGIAGSIHKNGSDGTVYVSTANLNSRSIKVIFSRNVEGGLHAKELEKYYDSIAFGVLYNRNHRTILEPKQKDELSYYLLQSLSIQNESEYRSHSEQLEKETKNTFISGLSLNDKKYHEYQNVVVNVHDQFGEPIEDFFLEFFHKGETKDKTMTKIQRSILEKVYPYPEKKNYRSFLFDITDIRTEILDKNKQIDMSIFAAKLSDHITYFNPKSHIPVARKNEEVLIKPNTTLMVDIELERIQAKEVFKLKLAR
jgi:hypothetical protein